jgi:hypothetical protein
MLAGRLKALGVTIGGKLAVFSIVTINISACPFAIAYFNFAGF